ncbi:MAG: hypothetical protein ACRDUV_11880, partial [Pseudonocardiaceae bacterium]
MSSDGTPPGQLSRDPERLPARHDDPQRRRRPQQRFDQPGAGFEDLLAVVEDHQGVEAGELLAQRVDDRAARLLPQSEGAGHHVGHEVGGRHRRQLDPPHPIRVALRDLGDSVQGEARLA